MISFYIDVLFIRSGTVPHCRPFDVAWRISHGIYFFFSISLIAFLIFISARIAGWGDLLNVHNFFFYVNSVTQCSHVCVSIVFHRYICFYDHYLTVSRSKARSTTIGKPLNQICLFVCLHFLLSKEM